MKNVHLIPTDKPSRLCYDKSDNLLFAPNAGFSTADGKQHIYITNDEEIKEGDWVISDQSLLSPLYDAIGKVEIINLETKKIIQSDNSWYWTDLDCKKIILTTDQDLIKDSVQAIDDEFLEWIVKNPSCEWVEVEGFEPIYGHQNNSTDILYRIMIPQEEPKTNLEKLPFPELVEELANYYKEVPLVEESKQETTLEEAENEFVKLLNGKALPTKQLTEVAEHYFIVGYETAHEKMFSEKEVLQLLHDLRGENPIEVGKWFEQFKKK